MTELQRCDDEIRQVELHLRGGHPDVAGLLLAFVDWHTERRLLRAEQETRRCWRRTQAYEGCTTGAIGEAGEPSRGEQASGNAVRLAQDSASRLHR